MSYTPFDPTKPNFSDGRATQVNSIRTNLTALRDAVVLGAMKGFNYSWSGGSAEQPTCQYEKNGSIWLRKTFTYSDGIPATMLLEKSMDGGGSYVTIGTITYTYDVDGNFDHGDWAV